MTRKFCDEGMGKITTEPMSPLHVLKKKKIIHLLMKNVNLASCALFYHSKRLWQHWGDSFYMKPCVSKHMNS